MKKMILIILIFITAYACFAQNVSLSYNHFSQQIIYAVNILQKSLLHSGYSINDKEADFSIEISVDSQKLGAESFLIKPDDKNIKICGGDGSGVIYGCLSLAEDLGNGISIQNIKKKNESPKLQFRAIKFDLPWDTYRHSYALTLHQSTCKDLKFWEAFLDMMCENRFNVLKSEESLVNPTI